MNNHAFDHVINTYKKYFRESGKKDKEINELIHMLIDKLYKK